MSPYLSLLLAIILETIATISLKKTEQFQELVPSIICIMGYLGAFYFLSLTLKTMPVGIVYAIWSGIGIVLITLAGIFIFQQKPDLPAIIGMSLIVSGVVCIQLFSKMNAH